MKFYYCPHCGRETGHKRALGWGTFFAVLLTGGLWLLAIPFYPKRCIICGSKEKPPRSKSELGSSIRQLIFLALLALLIVYIIDLSNNRYQTKKTQITQTIKTTKATKAKTTKTTQKKRHISRKSISNIKPLLSGRPINTLWEFEHSKYYRIMQFEKYPISSTEIGYHSPSRNVMVGLKLWNDKIIESRFAYLQNKLPDFGTFTSDVFFFIASFTGVYTYNEIKDLAGKIGNRLSDKSTQPFIVKGKTVIIDLIDTPSRSYLGVVIK